MRPLAFLLLYPLIQLPWLIFFLWPIPVGIWIGWGLGLWMLWWIPATVVLIKKDRWAWWLAIKDRVLLLAK